MSYFVINKSSVKVPVYDIYPGGTVIGHLWPREAFGLTSYTYEFPGVRFRDGSGVVRDGVVDGLSAPDLWHEPCTDYPYGTAPIGGITYFTFMFRRQESIYRPDASYWGSVAAGRRVACQNETSGTTHPEWKLINYVESSSGGWVLVAGNYGFVNTGLEDGSTPTTISMYGTW